MSKMGIMRLPGYVYWDCSAAIISNVFATWETTRLRKHHFEFNVRVTFFRLFLRNLNSCCVTTMAHPFLDCVAKKVSVDKEIQTHNLETQGMPDRAEGGVGGGGICNKTAHQIRVRVNACAVHAYISCERMRSACLHFV